MGPSSDSPQPRPPPPPRRLPPLCRGAWPTFTCTCGFSSGSWCSCWRCSSSPCTGWRTSSPPPPPQSPTAAARRAAPLPTWRSAASPLSAPRSPHCPPEGAQAHMGKYCITMHRHRACSSSRLVCPNPYGPVNLIHLAKEILSSQCGEAWRWINPSKGLISTVQTHSNFPIPPTFTFSVLQHVCNIHLLKC